MPSVNEVTTFAKAAPITNATAMSTRLPFMAKSLNSLINAIVVGFSFGNDLFNCLVEGGDCKVLDTETPALARCFKEIVLV